MRQRIFIMCLQIPSYRLIDSFPQRRPSTCSSKSESPINNGAAVKFSYLASYYALTVAHRFVCSFPRLASSSHRCCGCFIVCSWPFRFSRRSTVASTGNWLSLLRVYLSQFSLVPFVACRSPCKPSVSESVTSVVKKSVPGIGMEIPRYERNPSA